MITAVYAGVLAAVYNNRPGLRKSKPETKCHDDIYTRRIFSGILSGRHITLQYITRFFQWSRLLVGSFAVVGGRAQRRHQSRD